MSKDIERQLREEMGRNLEGQKADYPAPCQVCGAEFLYPAREVVLGGRVVCPHCGGRFTVPGNAADALVDGVKKFQRDFERRSRNRRRR